MPSRRVAKSFPSLVHLIVARARGALPSGHILNALASVTLLSFIATSAPAIQCEAPSDLHRLEYEIQWMGDRVGELVIAFDRLDEQLKVQNRIDVDARFFFHSLFRFTHVSEEQWHQGSLVDFRGVTVDNGSRREVRVSPRATGFYVDGKGGPYEVPRNTPLLSAWCKGSILGPTVIEPTKGRIKTLTVRRLTKDSVRPGHPLPSSSKVRIDGDLRAEIWYDDRGIVTFAQFPVKGGTRGALVLTAP